MITEYFAEIERTVILFFAASAREDAELLVDFRHI